MIHDIIDLTSPRRTINMTTDEKRSAKEDTTSTDPLLCHNEEPAEVCLCRSGTDRYGRRSMLYQRKKTGEIATATELDETGTSDPPMLNFFHRWDLWVCWSHCEGIRPGLLRKACQCLQAPFCLVWLGYVVVMFRWDCWRMGYPRDEEEGSGEVAAGEDGAS